MPIHSIMNRARRGGVDLVFPALVVGGVLVLSSLGISGSSLSIWSRSGAVDQSSLITGTPRPVRSDEWLVEAPIKIGQARTGFRDERLFGMGFHDVSWRQRVPSRSFGTFYKPFDVPITVLPIRQAFALQWWLPFAACAIGIYAWLRLLQVQEGVALCAAVLLTTAPDAVWWSGWLPESTALAVVPCALLAAATRVWERHRKGALLLALAGGLAAAQLPWLYPPWVVPLGLFSGMVTALWGLGTRDRRRAFLWLSAVAVSVFGLESLIYYIHEHGYYTVLGQTVYPGGRRFSGGGLRVGKLLSSLFPFAVVGKQGASLVQTNLSEISMGWTLLLPVGLGVSVLGRKALHAGPERVLIAGTATLAMVLTSWCLIEWPDPLPKVSLLMLSPPDRVASLVGYFGVVLLALLLGEPTRRERLLQEIGIGGAIILAGSSMLLAAWGATEFRNTYLPTLSLVSVWVTVIVVTAIVFALATRFWAIGLVTATVIAVLSGMLVNPLMRGLGPLYDSDEAKLIRRIDRQIVAPQGGTWAADTYAANGLLNAQGVDSLSSFNDPIDPAGWRVLDPEGKFTSQWSRLAVINFVWRGEGDGPSIEAPDANKVVVVIDPCSRRLSQLRLAVIVSAQPLSRPCLAELAHLTWQGNGLTLYSVGPHGP